jgi:DNA polymerase type B, organellar and viral
MECGARHTDMYVPYAKYVRSYDVNGLYPSVMKWSMPTAFPKSLAPQNNEYHIKEFVGDISLINSDPFGFFEVEVTCPDYIKEPILPVHFNGKTIYPTGTWKGWYNSEELKNAANYGYTYNIFKGYFFHKEEIFVDFVTDLYEIRSKYSKDDPLYFIIKLLMNSLYGRYGMELIIHDLIIINNEDYQDFDNKGIILDRLDLDNEHCMITWINPEKHEDLYFNNIKNNNNNISVPIAAAITAYARIFMSKFKNVNESIFKLFYSDTDSIHIIIYDKQKFDILFPNLIGNGLGQLKIVHKFKKVIYIAPKVYAGITEDGQEIIKAKGLKIKPTAFGT